jgi:CHAT domain-containing protein
MSKYKKLVVITDGYLSGIPFGLLSESSVKYEPLVKNHDILYTPSMSFLARQRGLKDRGVRPDKLLALADPAFGGRNLADAAGGGVETRNYFAAAEGALGLFTPLPETRTEVKNIGSLFKAENVTYLFADKAAESVIKSMPLEGYRYLHFATHGILGDQIPGVAEPALVMADEGKKEDGFLTVSEVEKLKLDSDLVVLSACDTGSGKYFQGEGVMGLSRGFILAGSRAVLVSLWPVDSKATVAFMTRFYAHLKSGKSKAESLRLTQLEFMAGAEQGGSSAERSIAAKRTVDSSAETSHPYYWAPFVLIGE